MNFSNLIYLLEDQDLICQDPAIVSISYLGGIVLFAIKVAVPVILIAVGMVDLLKAISQQDENALKKATSALTKKAVAAVAVFLVALIVGLLMTLVGGPDYKECLKCINNPWQTGCGVKTD